MYHVKDSYPEAPASYVHPGTWKATATLLVQLVGMATTVVWNAVATVLMIIPVFIRTEVA